MRLTSRLTVDADRPSCLAICWNDDPASYTSWLRRAYHRCPSNQGKISHRIRHYGLLAGATRKAHLKRARELLGVAPPAAPDARAEPDDIRPPCPCCGGRMVVVETFERQVPASRATASCTTVLAAGVVILTPVPSPSPPPLARTFQRAEVHDILSFAGRADAIEIVSLTNGAVVWARHHQR